MKKLSLIVIFVVAMLSNISASEISELNYDFWGNIIYKAQLGYVIGFIASAETHYEWLLEKDYNIPKEDYIEIFDYPVLAGELSDAIDRYYINNPDKRSDPVNYVILWIMQKDYWNK